ncbi:hypothetical protein Ddye_018304 [Dipteronia dyeriana]|uniref:Uncharacterized protein n=1 Tax=Dipteronia dyeriana TaxID=168575 RepID=A0AAD9UB78_9ROSI|nr:hypothetical protein Ddye_018304 [Dipteronia dyeriana]
MYKVEDVGTNIRNHHAAKSHSITFRSSCLQQNQNPSPSQIFNNRKITFDQCEFCFSILMNDSLQLYKPRAPRDYCIYEVPYCPSRKSDGVYTPMLFSIGPIHYGKAELSIMEEQKRRYYEKFRSRIPDDSLEEFKSFLHREETRILGRYRYGCGTFSFQMVEFQRIVFNDSIFIFELLLGDHDEVNDGFLNETCEQNALIKRDLMLLENQLPYFILEHLYKLLSGYQSYPSLMNLSCKFFGLRMPKENSVQHFTDLARSSLVGVFPRDSERSNGRFMSLPTAKELKKLGVIFEPVVGGCVADMKVLSVKFIVRFFKFQIPRLEVNILSECIFQNVMAFEMCAYKSMMQCHVSNFLYLMGCLVYYEDDFNVLVTEKIISNKLGDGADVIKLFKRVFAGRVAHPDRDIWGVCEPLRSLVDY